MLFFGDASEVLTPGPVHLLVLLAALWWWCPHSLGRGIRIRFRTLISLVFVWVWVFSTPAIANLALRQLEGKRPDQATVINQAATHVVLGAGTPASADVSGRAQLNLAGWRRVQAAVNHWQKSGGHLLFVGGLSAPDNPTTSSLATEMRALAVQWGVPNEAITTAGHQSQNTREDLAAAAQVLSTRAQPVANPTYLITSAGHMPRSIGVADKLGLSLTPLPTDWRQLNNHGWRAWFPNNGGPAFWRLSLYELLGSVVYGWRGWL
ncbi:MAG: YdcF family protein [Burkholderiaceae bacterium]